jgi:phosphoglycolate phosphatase-like HAD superfamily hydrolase
VQGQQERGLIFQRVNFDVSSKMGKPHPSMILQALSETGINGNDAIMIGDTVHDMQMAVATGVRAIGVAWGYHHMDVPPVRVTSLKISCAFANTSFQA